MSRGGCKNFLWQVPNQKIKKGETIMTEETKIENGEGEGVEEVMNIRSKDVKVSKGDMIDDERCYGVITCATEEIGTEMSSRMEAKGFEVESAEDNDKDEYDGKGVTLFFIILDYKAFKLAFKDAKKIGKQPRELSTLQKAKKAISHVSKLQKKVEKNKEAIETAKANLAASIEEYEAAKENAKELSGNLKSLIVESAEKAAEKARVAAERAKKKAEEAAKLAEEFSMESDDEVFDEEEPGGDFPE